MPGERARVTDLEHLQEGGAMSPQSDPNDSTVADEYSSPTAEQKLASTPMDLIGTVVGSRYLIERELGRGGIGAVYLARDKPELMSRRVVVKVLLEASLKNEWIVQKFRQEVESLTRLDDPGVVGIFDAGTLPDGTPYLVMQFVDGVSLRAELCPGGMAFERTADLIRQVGRTLTVAHNEGIIHRDLKPENIMLRTTKNGEVQVKVIDFGIAKVKNSVVAPSTITGLGVAGTIRYMSPEQLSAQKITPASDVYALGVIAYEMLTGIRPFNPETAYQLLEMQREGVRVRPKDLRPALPEAAQQVIFKALAFEPKERYQHAREFGEALARAFTDESDIHAASTLSFHEEKPVHTSDTHHDPGEVEIKHGVRTNRVNLYTNELGNPELPEKLQKSKRRSFFLPVLAAILLVAALAGALVLWTAWNRNGVSTKPDDSQAGLTAPVTERVYTYFLTPSDRGRGSEEERFTGNEQFHNGSKFRFVLIPEQSGALYLLNQGAGANETESWNVLFPTPKNNNGSSHVGTRRRMEARINFDMNPGTENLSIIWAAQPISELETIFKDAAKTDFEIKDPTQIATIKDFLVRYGSPEPKVEIDTSKNQTSVRGKGEIFIRKLVLKHFNF